MDIGSHFAAYIANQFGPFALYNRLCRFVTSHYTILVYDGSQVSNLLESLQRWQQLFQMLLHHPVLSAAFASNKADMQYDCSLHQSSQDEVRNALCQLRNNRTEGKGGIPTEVYPKFSYRGLFTKIWIFEKCPTDRQEALLLSFLQEKWQIVLLKLPWYQFYWCAC